MSCANTNWPEYMMGNSGEKIPVSQRIQVQVGDTPRHAISHFRSSCYITVLAKLPDTTDTPSTYTPSTPPQPDVRAANTPVVQNMSYMLMEQDKIKSRLKDPDSAEFRNVFVSSKYTVCGEVNAKNSFGGNTGFVRFISGGDLQVVESDMAAGEMDKAWPQFCKR